MNLAPRLIAVSLVAGAALWSLAVVTHQGEPFGTDSAVLLTIGLLMFALISAVGLLLPRGRWARNLAKGILALEILLALAIPLDGWSVAALVATAVGIVGVQGRWLDGWLRRLPAAEGPSLEAMLFLLGTLALTPAIALASPSGVEIRQGLLAATGLLAAWGIQQGSPLGSVVGETRSGSNDASRRMGNLSIGSDGRGGFHCHLRARPRMARLATRHTPRHRSAAGQPPRRPATPAQGRGGQLKGGTDAVMVVATAALGLLAGMLFTPGGAWAVLGLVIGVALGLMMARAAVRPAVGTSIVGSAIAGAWIGREIVKALCLPGSCPGLEAGGAIFTAVGAMIGVGLVVALVVRSFDEYRQSG